MARKVLITGGAGFVGRHFCKNFLDAGDEVYCVDPVVPLTGGIFPFDTSLGYKKNAWPLFSPSDYSNFHFIGEDCRKFFKINEEDYFDIAIHLAAVVGGREIIENNPLAVADDLSIDAAFWQWAAKAKPKKIVFFSSSAAYPINLQTKNRNYPLQELNIDFSGTFDIGMPDLSYGWAKLTGEYLAKLAYKNYGLKSVVYRPFSGYGEDQHDNYPFPAICKRMLGQKGKEEPFIVWGSGEQIRDFIHIDDVVNGVISTMDKINDADVLNLSTGIGTNFKQLAALAGKYIDYFPEIIGQSDKPEGVFARVGNTERQKQYGFEPKITIEDGTKRMMEHLQK